MTKMHHRAATSPRGGMRRAALVALLALALAALVGGTAAGGDLPAELDREDLGTMPAVGFQTQAEAGTVIPILFPFEERITWQDTWGDPRSGGTRSHRGNDLPAPKGTPILAVVDGELDWMNMEEEPSSYNGVPAFNILLRGDDGNVYFYIHLNNDTPGTDDGKGGVRYAYAPGLTNGTHVTQGQLIGYVGDSGNAEESISHLHFELHVGGYGDANAIDPYPSLMAAPTLGEQGGSLRVFRDVSEQEWYYEDLMWLHELGIVKGSADGLFNAYTDVTRAQFAALLVRALVDDELNGAVVETPGFSDVEPGYWANAEIGTAAGLGVVRGRDDGTFAPDLPITRAQMAAMICRMIAAVETGAPVSPREVATLSGDAPADGTSGEEPPPEPVAGPFSDVPADYWAAPDITDASAMRLLNGRSDGTFDPAGNTKRVHASVVIARTLRLLETAPTVP